MKNIKKTGGGVLRLLALQAAVFLYSLNSMFSKYVSLSIKGNGLFSGQTFLAAAAFGGSILVYALIWQQILKKVELSVAYSNKAVGLLWSLVWSVLLFGEKVTFWNIVGMLVICIGVIMVTGNEE